MTKEYCISATAECDYRSLVISDHSPLIMKAARLYAHQLQQRNATKTSPTINYEQYLKHTKLTQVLYTSDLPSSPSALDDFFLKILEYSLGRRGAGC